MAMVMRRGSGLNDVLKSNHRLDMLMGLDGEDLLLDAGKRGQTDIDYFSGGRGHDHIFSRWGADNLRGDNAGDMLVSRSDAGEPDIAQDAAAPKSYPGEALTACNDTLNGGLGNDTFRFQLDLNATATLIAAHTDMAGDIDWAAIAGAVPGDGHDHEVMADEPVAEPGDEVMPIEPAAPHDHWVEGIGMDRITDFYRNEGDRIVIEGHSVAASIRYGDRNRDGRDDFSIIRLTSDEGGVGPHHGDALGIIVVYGDLVVMEDLIIDSTVTYGVADSIDELLSWTITGATAGDDVLRSMGTDARLSSLDGNDSIFDGGRQGDRDLDVFDGGAGNDVIRSQWGKDNLFGGLGDDILVSRSDAGEPEIGQRNANNRLKYYLDEPLLAANDTMTGGLGADTFFFRLDLDARTDILEESAHHDGEISWHQVAGYNDAIHLHWVESIGRDTIRDFYRDEGDRIVIEGHTVIADIYYRDTTGDKRVDMSIIVLSSEQGDRGSHDEDIVGTIYVYGNLVRWDDLSTNAGVHHGAYGTLDEFAIA